MNLPTIKALEVTLEGIEEGYDLNAIDEDVLNRIYHVIYAFAAAGYEAQRGLIITGSPPESVDYVLGLLGLD